MTTLYSSAPAIETLPETQPAPVETIPDNPHDPFGVDRKIIEEIEEIGRRYVEPQK